MYRFWTQKNAQRHEKINPTESTQRNLSSGRETRSQKTHKASVRGLNLFLVLLRPTVWVVCFCVQYVLLCMPRFYSGLWTWFGLSTTLGLNLILIMAPLTFIKRLSIYGKNVIQSRMSPQDQTFL